MLIGKRVGVISELRCLCIILFPVIQPLNTDTAYSIKLILFTCPQSWVHSHIILQISLQLVQLYISEITLLTDFCLTLLLTAPEPPIFLVGGKKKAVATDPAGLFLVKWLVAGFAKWSMRLYHLITSFLYLQNSKITREKLFALLFFILNLYPLMCLYTLPLNCIC